MAEMKKTELDELAELRERVKSLEAELKKEKKERKADRLTDSLTSVTDEISKLTLGFFYAGAESLAQVADVTRTFVNKTSDENAKRKVGNERLMYLPVDMAEGFVEALDESTRSVKKVVDKFNEKYSEK